MVRVGVLGEDKQLARIVGPVAQMVKVERAPERCGCRRSFDASQRIAIPHAPPTLHFASPLSCTGTESTDGTRSHTGSKGSPVLPVLVSRTWDCFFSTRHSSGALPNALTKGWLVDH